MEKGYRESDYNFRIKQNEIIPQFTDDYHLWKYTPNTKPQPSSSYKISMYVFILLLLIPIVLIFTIPGADDDVKMIISFLSIIMLYGGFMGIFLLKKNSPNEFYNMFAMAYDEENKLYLFRLASPEFIKATHLTKFHFYGSYSTNVMAMNSRRRANKKMANEMLNIVSEYQYLEQFMQKGGYVDIAIPINKITSIKDKEWYFIVNYSLTIDGKETNDRVIFYNDLPYYDELKNRCFWFMEHSN